MDIQALEEKLRLKIAQARKNGFDVVPYFSEYGYEFGAIDMLQRKCCLFGAASDLAATQSENLDVQVNWLPRGVEMGFEHEESSTEEEKLGAKLRRECLAYMAAKRKSQG